MSGVSVTAEDRQIVRDHLWEHGRGEPTAFDCMAPVSVECIAQIRADAAEQARREEREAWRELLAEQAHIMWAHWMKYQDGCCDIGPNGSLIIPRTCVAHWRRLMRTDYADLTETERESDREQADRILAAIRARTSEPDEETRTG